MSKKTGGPAFPQAADANGNPSGLMCDTGMTLRDYFAAAALTGIMANGDYSKTTGAKTYPEGYASLAYIYADAMIAEREKA